MLMDSLTVKLEGVVGTEYQGMYQVGLWVKLPNGRSVNIGISDDDAKALLRSIPEALKVVQMIRKMEANKPDFPKPSEN
jgi:hypothetical protein